MASTITQTTAPSSITPNDSISRVSISSASDNDAADAPSSLTVPTRKRKRAGRRDEVWKHARRPITGHEPVREMSGKDNRRIWYCSFVGCEEYRTLSTAGARNHLSSTHRIGLTKTPITHLGLIQADLTTVVNKQKQEQHKMEDMVVKEHLRRALDRDRCTYKCAGGTKRYRRRFDGRRIYRTGASTPPLRSSVLRARSQPPCMYQAL